MRWTSSTSSPSSVGNSRRLPRRSAPASGGRSSDESGGSKVFSVATCAGPAFSTGKARTGSSSKRRHASISGSSASSGRIESRTWAEAGLRRAGSSASRRRPRPSRRAAGRGITATAAPRSRRSSPSTTGAEAGVIGETRSSVPSATTLDLLEAAVAQRALDERRDRPLPASRVGLDRGAVAGDGDALRHRAARGGRLGELARRDRAAASARSGRPRSARRARARRAARSAAATPCSIISAVAAELRVEPARHARSSARTRTRSRAACAGRGRPG